MKYQFENTMARDGHPVLTVIDKEKRIRLNSAYRPVEEAKKWASQYDTKHFGMLILMFGLGNGSFLNALTEQCAPDTRILVYEPCAELFLLEEEFLPETVKKQMESGRIILVTPEGEVTLFQALSENVTWEGKKLSVLHPQYDRLYPEEYAQFQKELLDAQKRAEAQKNTANAFGRKILKNQLYLLGELRRLYFLPELCLNRKRPVVIAASGPSLAESIGALTECRPDFWLMAVDSSVPFLLNRGLTPDFIVTIDPNKYAKHLEKEQAKKIPLFCRMDSNERIVKTHQGPLIVIGSSSFAAGIFEHAGQCPKWIEDTGGSVSTAAYAVCETLGFEKIILVGQDLCYRMQDQQTIAATHANGKISPDEKKQGFDRGYVEGNEEEKVLTRQDWYRYLKWFENKLSHTPAEVINATIGGAKIHGARRMSLKEALKDTGELEKQPSPVLTHTLLSENEYQAVEALVHSFPEQLGQLREATRTVLILSHTLAERAKKRILGQSPEDSKGMKQVAALNQWMEQQPLYPAVELLLLREEDSMDEFGADEMEELRITYEQVEKIYQKLETAYEKLEELLNENTAR